MPTTSLISNILNYLGLISFYALVFLAVVQILRLRQAKETISSLQKALEEMDGQAKLIVRTDLELNKAQEELDKRISVLYALQRLSQNLSKTLDEREIFNAISQDFIREIGFYKASVFIEDKSKNLIFRHYLGYLEEELAIIVGYPEFGELYNIIKGKNSVLSSLSSDRRTAQIIHTLFKLNSFVISPIVKKDGVCGLIILGNDSAATPLTEGDEELVSILTTQIGQALETAELFETVYLQQQNLEKKVNERTRELSGALEEIKTVSKRKTDFVSAVSHELRTPLTSIKGYASILLAEKLGKLPPEVKERLEKINRHSDELTHMVNDLLDIAHIESGKFEMKPEALELKNILDSITDLFQPQLKDRTIQVQLDIPADLSKIVADKTQLSRVFINLLGNAIKFVPQGSGIIKISAAEFADTVQIDISDNGIGMSPSDCARIFDEFYRVDNAVNQTVKGTGLGLTLVKNIIQAHKGKIWVTSQINQGSTFSFTLPKAK